MEADDRLSEVPSVSHSTWAASRRRGKEDETRPQLSRAPHANRQDFAFKDARQGWHYPPGLTPGEHLWRYLVPVSDPARPGREVVPLRVWMPDTVVFPAAQTISDGEMDRDRSMQERTSPFWLFCDAEGRIQCSYDVAEKRVLVRFGARTYDDPVAVLRQPQHVVARSDELNSTFRRSLRVSPDHSEARVLTTRELRGFLSQPHGMAGEGEPRTTVLQRFMKGRGRHAAILRCHWRQPARPAPLPAAWRITNRKRFDDHDEDAWAVHEAARARHDPDSAGEQLARTMLVNSGDLDECWIQEVAPAAIDEPLRLTAQVAAHLSTALGGRELSDLVCDWIQAPESLVREFQRQRGLGPEDEGDMGKAFASRGTGAGRHPSAASAKVHISHTPPPRWWLVGIRAFQLECERNGRPLSRAPPPPPLLPPRAGTAHGSLRPQSAPLVNGGGGAKEGHHGSHMRQRLSALLGRAEGRVPIDPGDVAVRAGQLTQTNPLLLAGVEEWPEGSREVEALRDVAETVNQIPPLEQVAEMLDDTQPDMRASQISVHRKGRSSALLHSPPARMYTKQGAAGVVDRMVRVEEQETFHRREVNLHRALRGDETVEPPPVRVQETPQTERGSDERDARTPPHLVAEVALPWTPVPVGADRRGGAGRKRGFGFDAEIEERLGERPGEEEGETEHERGEEDQPRETADPLAGTFAELERDTSPPFRGPDKTAVPTPVESPVRSRGIRDDIVQTPPGKKALEETSATRRLFSCALCQHAFDNRFLPFSLSLRMMADAAAHLRQRLPQGTLNRLPWLTRADLVAAARAPEEQLPSDEEDGGRRGAHSKRGQGRSGPRKGVFGDLLRRHGGSAKTSAHLLSAFASSIEGRVCATCYEMYQREVALIEVERDWARLLGFRGSDVTLQRDQLRECVGGSEETRAAAFLNSGAQLSQRGSSGRREDDDDGTGGGSRFFGWDRPGWLTLEGGRAEDAEQLLQQWGKRIVGSTGVWKKTGARVRSVIAALKRAKDAGYQRKTKQESSGRNRLLKAFQSMAALEGGVPAASNAVSGTRVKSIVEEVVSGLHRDVGRTVAPAEGSESRAALQSKAAPREDEWVDHWRCPDVQGDGIPVSLASPNWGRLRREAGQRAAEENSGSGTPTLSPRRSQRPAPKREGEEGIRRKIQFELPQKPLRADAFSRRSARLPGPRQQPERVVLQSFRSAIASARATKPALEEAMDRPTTPVGRRQPKPHLSPLRNSSGGRPESSKVAKGKKRLETKPKDKEDGRRAKEEEEEDVAESTWRNAAVPPKMTMCRILLVLQEVRFPASMMIPRQPLQSASPPLPSECPSPQDSEDAHLGFLEPHWSAPLLGRPHPEALLQRQQAREKARHVLRRGWEVVVQAWDEWRKAHGLTMETRSHDVSQRRTEEGADDGEEDMKREPEEEEGAGQEEEQEGEEEEYSSDSEVEEGQYGAAPPNGPPKLAELFPGIPVSLQGTAAQYRSQTPDPLFPELPPPPPRSSPPPPPPPRRSPAQEVDAPSPPPRVPQPSGEVSKRDAGPDLANAEALMESAAVERDEKRRKEDTDSSVSERRRRKVKKSKKKIAAGPGSAHRVRIAGKSWSAAWETWVALWRTEVRAERRRRLEEEKLLQSHVSARVSFLGSHAWFPVRAEREGEDHSPVLPLRYFLLIPVLASDTPRDGHLPLSSGLLHFLKNRSHVEVSFWRWIWHEPSPAEPHPAARHGARRRSSSRSAQRRLSRFRAAARVIGSLSRHSRTEWVRECIGVAETTMEQLRSQFLLKSDENLSILAADAAQGGTDASVRGSLRLSLGLQRCRDDVVTEQYLPYLRFYHGVWVPQSTDTAAQLVAGEPWPNDWLDSLPEPTFSATMQGTPSSRDAHSSRRSPRQPSALRLPSPVRRKLANSSPREEAYSSDEFESDAPDDESGSAARPGRSTRGGRSPPSSSGPFRQPTLTQGAAAPSPQGTSPAVPTPLWNESRKRRASMASVASLPDDLFHVDRVPVPDAPDQSTKWRQRRRLSVEDLRHETQRVLQETKERTEAEERTHMLEAMRLGAQVREVVTEEARRRARRQSQPE